MRLRLLALVVGLVVSGAPPAAAMSITQFARHTPDEQGAILVRAVNQIVDEVGKTDRTRAQAIHDYFYVKAPGQSATEGLAKLDAELRRVVQLGRQGRADLDKIQIEALLLDVITVNVLHQKPAAPPTR